MNVSFVQKLKRFFFEALAAAFMAFGAVGVVTTVSAAATFKSAPAHKPADRGLAGLPPYALAIGTALILGMAFYFNGHACRMRRDQIELPPVTTSDPE